MLNKVPWKIKGVWRNIWAREDLKRQEHRFVRSILAKRKERRVIILDDAPIHLKVK